MDFSTATILITGGNSGIGRGLAEALSARGAEVVITRRDAGRLGQILDANPGMSGCELEVARSGDVDRFAAMVKERHPGLNAVIHNAGILPYEKVLDEPYDLGSVERTVATNLLGPIRLTAGLLPHLRTKDEAAIVTVTSGLAFVPLASASAHSATKAAMHSWSVGLRHERRHTNVSVVRIAPRLVATELTPGQSGNPHAMPLDAFVAEAVHLLCADVPPAEVLVQRVLPQRTAERTGSFDKVFSLINPS